ncbi:inositol oxygenase [Phascolomyces articulosus]|uniref:Inositol oxygenase n=1 Tax=Phascolomyces articulosus TaxID=60185 RepID=A0AAD5JQJ9_9FUNG|nr:inositol oxygenase [Phascolomyces articulosus]
MSAQVASNIQDTEHQWEEFLKKKYGPYKTSTETKHFQEPIIAELADAKMEAFLLENHEKQTFEHVQTMKEKYGKLDKAYMGIWDMLLELDKIQLSKKDPQVPQKVHGFQMAEAMRREGQPRWLILTGLIHDLGKYMYLLGEKPWTVVGETFPVGCKFSNRVAYPRFFENNPDTKNKVYSTKLGIYEPHCGLSNVNFSFGHDEYFYMVCKELGLPQEMLYIIRFHSFYSCLLEGDYTFLLTEHDIEMMKWVKVFLQYDLYSRGEKIPVDINELKPYYDGLIAEYFPEKIRW